MEQWIGFHKELQRLQWIVKIILKDYGGDAVEISTGTGGHSSVDESSVKLYVEIRSNLFLV